MNISRLGKGRSGTSGVSSDVARQLLFEATLLYEQCLDGGKISLIDFHVNGISAASKLQVALNDRGIANIDLVIISGAILFVFQGPIRNLEHNLMIDHGKSFAEWLGLNDTETWKAAHEFAEIVSEMQSRDFTQSLNVTEAVWWMSHEKES